jgi:hypothetical protein
MIHCEYNDSDAVLIVYAKRLQDKTFSVSHKP